MEKSKNPNMQTQSALFNISHKTPRQTHSCTYTTHTNIHSNRYPCRGTIQDTATQLSLLTIGHKDTHYCEDTLTTSGTETHRYTHATHKYTQRHRHTASISTQSQRCEGSQTWVHMYTNTYTFTQAHRAAETLSRTQPYGQLLLHITTKTHTPVFTTSCTSEQTHSWPYNHRHIGLYACVRTPTPPDMGWCV